MKLKIGILFAFGLSLQAQNNINGGGVPFQFTVVAADPSGGCAVATLPVYSTASNQFFGCANGVWQQIGSSTASTAWSAITSGTNANTLATSNTIGPVSAASGVITSNKAFVTTIGSLPTGATGKFYYITNGASATDCTTGGGSTPVFCVYNGSAYVALGSGAGGSSAFNAITSGTNTTAAMVVGAGASLTPTSTGVVAANELLTVPFCSGFSPTEGQAIEWTAASSPNPCYKAATPSGSSAFNALTSGTNTTAAMVVGTGGSLNPSGTGVVNANQLLTVPFCTGFSPATSQVLTYVTTSSPVPCYTATTPTGSGNVSGPGTSTNGYVPQWNGTSGTAISTGLPVTQAGAASSLIETDSSGNAQLTGGLSSGVGSGSSGVSGYAGGSQSTALAFMPTNSVGAIGPSSAPTGQHYFAYPLIGAAANQFFLYGAESSSVSTPVLTTFTSTNLTDSTALVRNNQANTGTTAMTIDLHSSTVANAFRVPSSPSATATAVGGIAYDTTANMLHAAQTGADAMIPEFTVTPTNSDCVTWVVSGATYKLGDSGAGCGGSGSVNVNTLANAYFVVASGTNSYSGSVSSGYPAAYANGQVIHLYIPNTNTGASTLTMAGGAGTTNITKNGGSALTGGELVAGHTYQLTWINGYSAFDFNVSTGGGGGGSPGGSTNDIQTNGGGSTFGAITSATSTDPQVPIQVASSAAIMSRIYPAGGPILANAKLIPLYLQTSETGGTHYQYYTLDNPGGLSGLQANITTYLVPGAGTIRPELSITNLGGSGTTSTGNSLTFSGGGCSTQPVGTYDIAAGVLSAYRLTALGVGCTSAPTVAATANGLTGAVITATFNATKRALWVGVWNTSAGSASQAVISQNTAGTLIPIGSFFTTTGGTSTALGYVFPAGTSIDITISNSNVNSSLTAIEFDANSGLFSVAVTPSAVGVATLYTVPAGSHAMAVNPSNLSNPSGRLQSVNTTGTTEAVNAYAVLPGGTAATSNLTGTSLGTANSITSATMSATMVGGGTFQYYSPVNSTSIGIWATFITDTGSH